MASPSRTTPTSATSATFSGGSKASYEQVKDTARVMDRSWEVIQKKTFTNWINNQLKKSDLPPIVDLDTDLSSGESLIQLLEIIGDESLGKYTRAPRLRLQKIENVNKALEYIKKRGVNLTNIGAEDIVDSNAKLILGLIWTIILRFTIANISEEGLTAKEGLLLWCQRRTTPYSADFFIKDFTFSWQDGLALCGLIHRHRPDLINYFALDKKQKHANTQLAFDVAERHLGIPKLFAVEDIVDVVRPDERSVMTYVAQYFHAFSALDKFGTAGRRVGQLGQVLHQAWEMQNDYERRVRELLESISGIQTIWGRATFSGYTDARRQLHEFEDYKTTTKRGWVTERRELDSLLGNIQTKLKTYNLKTYNPPPGYTLADLDHHWGVLVEAEASRKRSITHYIRESKDRLRKEYAQVANSFQEAINEISRQLASLQGDLEQQMDTTKSLIGRLEPVKRSLEQIQSLNDALVEANIDDNEYTIYTVEDLTFDFGLLTTSLTKKLGFIENQMVARTKTNFTPAQLEEYSETFKHFDRDNSNTLKREEFKAALQSEGTALKDDEFEQTFLQVSGGTDEISFEQFIDYLRNLEEDKTTPDQLLISFQTLAVDKSFVTEEDLYRGSIPPAIVEYLKANLPRTDNNGYDFTAFVSNVFDVQSA
ncbi:calponin homology domain-containing protein [Entophlyctis helioformis]|nr:calponin homology domain-containing protein [Entophlyctis helioformis]